MKVFLEKTNGEIKVNPKFACFVRQKNFSLVFLKKNSLNP